MDVTHGQIEAVKSNGPRTEPCEIRWYIGYQVIFGQVGLEPRKGGVGLFAEH